MADEDYIFMGEQVSGVHVDDEVFLLEKSPN